MALRRGRQGQGMGGKLKVKGTEVCVNLNKGDFVDG